MMRKLTLAWLALGALAPAGCGRHQAVGEIEAITAEVCACPQGDRPCVAAGMKKAVELQTKYQGARASNADNEAIRAAGQKLQECVNRILR
jgi:hypothetical protein